MRTSLSPSSSVPRSRFRIASGLGVAVLLSLAALACGSSATPSFTMNPDAGSDDAGKQMKLPQVEAGRLDGSLLDVSELFLTPASATVTVLNGATVRANYTLKAKLKSGATLGVVAQSIQFDRPDLASATSQDSPSAPIVLTAPTGASPYGGTGTLHVVYGGLSATATLTVKVAVVSYGAGLSSSSPAVVALGGGNGADGSTGAGSGDGGPFGLPADTSASILYPYDKTVWPLGLTSPRIMWNVPAAGDVYRVAYSEEFYSYDSYFTLASLPAQAPLDQTVWDHLSASNNAANGVDPLVFALARYDAATSKAYLTGTETWSIAPESLAGAIYYWSAAANAQNVRVGHVSRFYPGSGATPEQLYNGECVGCHAVNAKGTVLVGDVDDTVSLTPDAGKSPSEPPYANFTGTRAWASFDITQPTAPLVQQTTEYGADLALSPDGKWVVWGGQSIPETPGSKYMSLSDINGNVVASSGLDQMTLPGAADGGTSLYTPMMPAFSPDGTKLALVVSPTANDSFADNVLPEIPTPDAGGLTESIATLSFDETVPSFNPTLNTLFDSNNAAFAALGPGGTPWNGIAYPSFTPDSTAVAFHVGQYATGCNSFDWASPNPAVQCGDFSADNGALFIATLADKTPIRMANADTPPNPSDALSAVEPTFNPVVRGGYSWVVFTSLRAWGNQPWPAEVSTTPDGGYPEGGAPTDDLINAKRRLWVAAVDTTIGAVDPSHPAIYLEGQDDTPNMRAFWTLASCIATPGAPTPGEGDAGVSSDAGKTKGDAGSLACTNGFQCCSGFCEQGVCVDVSTLACTGTGGACKSQGDCCNPSAVQCLDGTCGIGMAK
jgi:hypothetical protein